MRANTEEPYRIVNKSDQRKLAQDIAHEMNDGITRERHAEVATAVLTSDWLREHDAVVRREALKEVKEFIEAQARAASNAQGDLGYHWSGLVRASWILGNLISDGKDGVSSVVGEEN